ncbi:DUF1801 domain-containing protein [Cellulomonas cellasea]|uniref:YdhG-like domain-containing protein n=1 Tax=Cellulomonas cellasea TaxID=43670 RepID=A0A7W4UED1_9CELL|nr:DUF1801 domain-containing protein [Cellulomonas cellasea]MBB2922023.1 hypothetical protein [Cellulomonas cellasea]
MASSDSSNKTVATDADVEAFVTGVEDGTRRADLRTVLGLMHQVTGEPPVMWGSSIVGFGSRHYRYATGREGDMPVLAAAARKTALTIYLWNGFEDYADLLDRLGPHSTGKGCLYLKRVADVDEEVLTVLLGRCWQDGTQDISEAPAPA